MLRQSPPLRRGSFVNYGLQFHLMHCKLWFTDRNVIEVRRTTEFDVWLSGLKDDRAIARIAARLARLAAGNRGDVKATSATSIHELRVDYGPGYRVYFTYRGPVVVVLLAGGDKRTQSKDIKRAAAIAATLE
jgi:putative addiction module killer protein